jgi:hypothetical protein
VVTTRSKSALEIAAVLRCWRRRNPNTLARLGLGRLIVGVDLHHQVTAPSLRLEQFERTWLEARSDDQVGDFVEEHAGEREVDDLADRCYIAERAHAVSAPRSHVSVGHRGEIVGGQELRRAVGIGQRSAHGSPRGARVLE